MNPFQVLSDAGANLDKADERGLTPTHIAAAKGARLDPPN
jgi:ankyrin repeat protein